MPTAAGPISSPKRKLAEALAETQAFQERAGLTYPDTDADDKLIDGTGGTRRIFYPTADADDLGELVDRGLTAVIDNGTNFELAALAEGNQYHLYPAGQFRLILADRDRYPGSLEDGKRDFENFVGQTLQQLAALAARSDRLAITRITQEHPPGLPPRDEEHARGGRFWQASYLIDWH